MTFKTTLAATALGTAVMMGGMVMAPAALMAQTAQPVEIEEVNEDELSAFVRATLAMSEVRDIYIQRIESAESETEQQELIEEGNTAMMTALEDEPGMSLERYFEINEAAQTDAELNERIVMLLEEMASEG
ncbi:MAG: DUF4168 domain-containing protein [Alkalilacustris sp.]